MLAHKHVGDKYRNGDNKSLETAIAPILTPFIIVVCGTEKVQYKVYFIKYKMQHRKQGCVKLGCKVVKIKPWTDL